MWGNLGISLFGPLTGALVATTTGSVPLAIAAIVVGCALGATLLGASAVFGATTGAPAMVSMRGMLGRRGSVVPTLLNIAQNIGWATMEIIVIATAAVAILGPAWRWPFVILAGAAATLMAVRPLGSVRLLRKVMVWLVLAASVFLFVQVLLQPRQAIPQDSVLGFWPAVDLAIAGVISYAPLAPDYSRHSRTRRDAFWGAFLGYGLAAVAYYTLGVFAVANLGAADVITALITLPAGAIAIGILLVDEVDEAFANVYSTTMSVQNLFPRLDRRIVAVDHRRDRDPARRAAGLQPVPVVPVPDRFGLRAAVRGRRGRLLRGQRPALGRQRSRPDTRGAGRRLGLRLRGVPAGLSRYRARLGGLLDRRGGHDRVHRPELARLLGRRDPRRRTGDAGPRPGGQKQEAGPCGLLRFVTSAHVSAVGHTCADVSRKVGEDRHVIVAHRGFAGRQPEMTRAAYAEAIAWCAKTQIPLGLECDVHFSADDQLICLHDLHVNRTATTRGRAIEMTVAELKSLDFGSRWVDQPAPAQRELITLAELLEMVRQARADHVPVSLEIETKHPNPRGARVEVRLAEMLSALRWDAPGSPVRVISFDRAAVKRLGRLLPGLDRTFLIEKQLGRWANGRLFDGVRVVGPDLVLVRADPDFVARAHARGNRVNVWTVNEPEDIEFCRELGVDGYTTDYPDRVAATAQAA